MRVGDSSEGKASLDPSITSETKRQYDEPLHGQEGEGQMSFFIGE